MTARDLSIVKVNDGDLLCCLVEQDIPGMQILMRDFGGVVQEDQPFNNPSSDDNSLSSQRGVGESVRFGPRCKQGEMLRLQARSNVAEVHAQGHSIKD